MPIYELECVQCHNKVEKLFTCIMNFITQEELAAKKNIELELARKKKFVGFDTIDTTNYTPDSASHQVCEMCGGFLELLPSLPSMQPDKYWAGHETTHAGYVTSGSFLKRFEKQNNLERVSNRDMEQVQKNARKKKQDDRQKNADNLNKFLEKELAPVEISNDGNTVKEQNKFNKVRT